MAKAPAPPEALTSLLTWEGPAVLSANQLFKATLRITFREALKPGAHVAVAARHFSDFGDAQTLDPRAENYVTFNSSRKELAWRLESAVEGRRHPWNRGMAFSLVSGEVVSGDVLTIVLGDSTGSCPGFRCQSFSETAFHLRLGIDAEANRRWRTVRKEDMPAFQIVGNRAVQVRLFISHATWTDAKTVCHVKAEDSYGNVAGEVPQSLSILSDQSAVLATVRPEANSASRTEVSVPDRTRWQRLTITSPDGSFAGQSNPIGPSPVKGYHLYWGEIHSQSVICDGTNSPAEVYKYAREAAGLDFASVTSHDFEIPPEGWEEIKRATRQAHQPGEFVTFLGYEWSGASAQGGDNNIYFMDDEAPLVHSAPFANPAWNPARLSITETLNLTQVIERLGDRPVMVVPHCGGRLCNFDFYNPAVMPLFEMHSCHRNYESIAWNALARGLRFGFIGGSDDHRGCLGDSHVAARDRYYSSHNGLVAVYAAELTRAALWEAFFAKRVYATNGTRLALDFRINDVLMGGDVSALAGAKLQCKVWTCLDGLLDRVEIMQGSSILQTVFAEPDRNQVRQFECVLEFPVQPGATPYYARVTQADGGKAWSSPIWVTAI